MPFTFAHPAAVLPLRRSRLLLTVPLIIGSLVPDAPYFFPQRLVRMLGDTHTLDGSITICIPLGMAFLIMTLLLREPLTALLGARTRWLCLRAIERFAERPLHWPIALLSILIGAWTHIAWDSFTHPFGWTTLRVAALSAPISLFGWDTEVNHLLQYVSSVFGLVVVTIWFRRRLAEVPADVERNASRVQPRWLVLIMIAGAATIVGVVRALLVWHFGTWYHLGYLLLTRTISWFALLYLAAGFAVMFNRFEAAPAR
jgi:Domain of unknown function (DUF4184)